MSLLPFNYDARPCRWMQRPFFQPEEIFNMHPLGAMMPRDFCQPQFIRPWNSFVRPMEQLAQAMNQMALTGAASSVTADEEKFEVNVDVQHFAPAEISVKVVDGQVLVEGKHEEKKDHHGYVSRQFVRKYALPQGCLPDTVTSKLSSDGVLTITAPKVLPLPSTGERIVPIAHTGPVQMESGNAIAQGAH